MRAEEIANILEQEIQLRARKIFEQLPEIKESFCFSCYLSESRHLPPYTFFVNLDIYLYVDGISLHPDNDKEVTEADELSKYFPFGENGLDRDCGEIIQELIEKMFDKEFIKLLGAYFILSECTYSGNLTFFKDGRKFKT